MTTSRFIPEIMNTFERALRLEVLASEKDVKRFVAGQMYRLPRCIQHDDTLQTMVQDQIAKAVDGIFLLARLHTESLLDKRTTKEVKLTLSSLAKGSDALDKAYSDALRRIEGQLEGDARLAKKALSWITLAKRPLTTSELCCALAVEPNESELDPEHTPDIEDIVSVCAGLVVIDPESAIIRLVHYTTQEYFERIGDAWYPTIQQEIALTCLTYLSFTEFQSGASSTDEDFERRIQQSKFLDYASKHWGEHVSAVGDEICELAASMLTNSGSVSCLTQVASVPKYKYRGYSQDYPRGVTGLHVTAKFELPILTALLLLKLGTGATVIVNKKNSNGQTPLYIAALHRHKGMVKLLLEKGADANAQGGYYGNALQLASFTGCKAIVKLLLEKGADVNARGGYYGNAFQAASFRGYEWILKLLLQNGTDINAQSGEYGNALQAASKEGHEAIVKLLLQNGADVNTQSGEHSNALQVASEEGHEVIVRLLLEKGADVNAQSGEYGNALQAASEEGHEAIIKLLLEKGADVNTQSGEYGNALQAASLRGHEAIVKLLLEKGADINTQSGEYGNALQAASLRGHEAIVKLLLEKGADVNAQGGYYGNALQAASFRGYEGIVKLLIEKGANVNAKGGKYSNALQPALSRGHKAIVKLLLEKGADVNA
ncbi:unnamed protein product [Periconia digitata]|uniref:GPI inositol-deacylase winged helix domain-containing protein n=1 Tax=Periconia digitata TaxID=1303443 RepID=A0A9W4U056_9PLEO|nr:unnamed protein product [Periconia digitata]